MYVAKSERVFCAWCSALLCVCCCAALHVSMATMAGIFGDDSPFDCVRIYSLFVRCCLPTVARYSILRILIMFTRFRSLIYTQWERGKFRKFLLLFFRLLFFYCSVKIVKKYLSNLVISPHSTQLLVVLPRPSLMTNLGEHQGKNETMNKWDVDKWSGRSAMIVTFSARRCSLSCRLLHTITRKCTERCISKQQQCCEI